jgi:hypothetical protein
MTERPNHCCVKTEAASVHLHSNNMPNSSSSSSSRVSQPLQESDGAMLLVYCSRCSMHVTGRLEMDPCNCQLNKDPQVHPE